jgi:ectoine hydroxylase-related dioxygenase (phytanoyl-CoA dioxygenase family)
MAIQTLDTDASPDDVLACLRRDGACIVENRLPADRLTHLINETQPLVDHSHNGDDGFSGHLTRRTGALVAASPACREIVQDELVLEVARQFLAPYCRRIQLMLTQVISIYPGETDQLLHRDRLAWGGYVPNEIETQLNTMWAITDFTLENGATRVVPGSATWPTEREAKPEEVERAVMAKGSVLFFTGSVIHAGGGNQSDSVRMGLNIDYCLDWLRQEENQYLSCPPDIARQLPQSLTDLMGYTAGGFTVGYYTDPSEGHERGTRQAEEAVGYLPPKVGLVQ